MLQQWQTQFHRALLYQPDTDFLHHFHGPNESIEQRFAIYRNNISHALHDALGATFSTVKAMCGDDFFNAAASLYFQQYPPEKAAMVFLGEHFADFLQALEQAQSIRWLADVARLEFARHQAYHAADAQPLSAEEIEPLAPEQLLALRLQPHPSVTLMQSPYPIHSLWQAQENGDYQRDDFTLDLGQAEHIIICRPQWNVETHLVSRAEMLFHQQLSGGEPLGECAEQASKHPDFDTSQAFALGIQAGLYTSLQ